MCPHLELSALSGSLGVSLSAPIFPGDHRDRSRRPSFSKERSGVESEVMLSLRYRLELGRSI